MAFPDVAGQTLAADVAVERARCAGAADAWQNLPKEFPAACTLYPRRLAKMRRGRLTADDRLARNVQSGDKVTSGHVAVRSPKRKYPDFSRFARYIALSALATSESAALPSAGKIAMPMLG